ncbi:unnamed protein product [Heligmosomoides polygyrus]|uniref:Fibronectin type-III domain-containing protein n=1 Tax=Heligmosomoides polygyrus TaxID=6339 RepID=A0A183FIE6_HELPZ|nr:unnamed protein product [Heligmosomoides polygyrus]
MKREEYEESEKQREGNVLPWNNRLTEDNAGYVLRVTYDTRRPARQIQFTAIGASQPDRRKHTDTYIVDVKRHGTRGPHELKQFDSEVVRCSTMIMAACAGPTPTAMRWSVGVGIVAIG